MLEKTVEQKLKWLEGFGFQVLKLRTPGVSGVMDRMILWPTWAPASPSFVEVKRPGEHERALQLEVAKLWNRRGCDILPMISTPAEVIMLRDYFIITAVRRFLASECRWGDLPSHVQSAYMEATTRP